MAVSHVPPAAALRHSSTPTLQHSNTPTLQHSIPHPLGIYSFFGYRLPLPEAFRGMRAAGFDATTLWWDDEGVEDLGADRRDLPAIARDCGLFVENVHVPFEHSNDLWSPDPAARACLVDAHLGWLDDCARHGIPCLVAHVSKDTGPSEAGRHGVESLARIVARAEDAGVLVAIENTRRLDCIDLLLSEIGSPALGLCYDSSHDWLHSGEPTGLLRRWGHRLAATHLSDNDGQADRHWLPGRGIVDWDRVLAAFPAAYARPLTMEVYASGDDLALSPAEFLRRAHAWVSALQARRNARPPA